MRTRHPGKPGDFERSRSIWPWPVRTTRDAVHQSVPTVRPLDSPGHESGLWRDEPSGIGHLDWPGGHPRSAGELETAVDHHDVPVSINHRCLVVMCLRIPVRLSMMAAPDDSARLEQRIERGSIRRLE